MQCMCHPCRLLLSGVTVTVSHGEYVALTQFKRYKRCIRHISTYVRIYRWHLSWGADFHVAIFLKRWYPASRKTKGKLKLIVNFPPLSDITVSPKTFACRTKVFSYFQFSFFACWAFSKPLIKSWCGINYVDKRTIKPLKLTCMYCTDSPDKSFRCFVILYIIGQLSW